MDTVELQDPLEALHKVQADKLGLTLDEYEVLSRTVKPEDTVDEAIIPTNLQQLNS